MPRTTTDINKDLNKDAFIQVYDALCQIRMRLRKCKSLDTYKEIVSNYNTINTQSESILQHLSAHKSAKLKLTELQGKIAILISARKLRYEIQSREFQEWAKKNISHTRYDTPVSSEDPTTDSSKIVPDVQSLELKTKEQQETSDEVKPLVELGSFKTNEIELQKQKTIKIIKLREQQISEYTKQLKKLEQKRDQFNLRYPDHSGDDVYTAYGSICKLVNILNGYAEQYKNQDIDLQQFKNNTSRVIQRERKGILGEHRGIKEILVNLLFAISTLGIGYAFAAFFTQSLTPIKCDTNTVTLMDETHSKLDEIVTSMEMVL